MIDGSKKRNRQLAFELQNSHVCEKRSKAQIRRKNKFVSVVNLAELTFDVFDRTRVTCTVK